MDPKLFQSFSKLTYEASGICLTEGKEVMLRARINRRINALGLYGPGEYLEILMNDSVGRETQRFISAITTNVTAFFREPAHFELVAKYVVEALRRGIRRFRFWCAACSTGEEAYTLAITVLQASAGENVDCQILATDIDPVVLATASEALYDARLLQAVPDVVREEFFRPVKDQYTVQKKVRSMVQFGRLNLIRPPYPMKGPFDIVFCRNVMIYFDPETRERLVCNIGGLLAEGSYLLIGHSETLTGLDVPFVSLAPATYIKRGHQ